MSVLESGLGLKPGQSIQSNNKQFTLTLQSDGNVVLYDQSRRALWATNTGSQLTPRDFVMQTDGNLVLYDTSGRPRWASNTWMNPGAFFVVQDDANLVVYRYGTQSQTASNALWAAGSNTQRPPAGGGVAEHMLGLVNQQRAAAGLPALSLNAQLTSAAQGHSNDMAAHNFMEHNGSDGSSPFDRIRRAGYAFSSAAENVAAGQSTPEAAVASWMDETPPNDGHRRNILSRDIRELGVGYAFSENTTFKHYWTQDFGAR